MGAEHSQQRADFNGREFFDRNRRTTTGSSKSSSSVTPNNNVKRRNVLRQNTAASSSSKTGVTNSPTTSELGRAPSPPLSVCSDQPPYVSYTDRPIGDSPKLRNKNSSSLLYGSSNSARNAAARKSYPGGSKPKRPQSASNHNIVIVKPGTKDNELDLDPDLARLRSVPQFLPVIRHTVSSASHTRDPEILERLPSMHLHNICARMQTHYNVCATQIATDQNKLVERTKMVSNTITTLFASFVDMQKTYASYAEQFAKIRQISQQLSRCNSLLNDNLQSLEIINDFLDVDDRLEPFVWRTDDGNKTTALGDEVAVIEGQLKRL